MGSREQMLKLKEFRESAARELTELEMQVREARVKVKTLDLAISAMDGSPVPIAASLSKNSPVGVNVKKTVLDIVVEAGVDGVSAAEVVKKAADGGRDLNSTSVSSLLSRLKREGTLELVDGRYVPTKPKPRLALTLLGGVPSSPIKAAE